MVILQQLCDWNVKSLPHGDFAAEEVGFELFGEHWIIHEISTQLSVLYQQLHLDNSTRRYKERIKFYCFVSS